MSEPYAPARGGSRRFRGVRSSVPPVGASMPHASEGMLRPRARRAIPPAPEIRRNVDRLVARLLDHVLEREVFLIGDEEGPLLSPSQPKATSGDVLLVFAKRADAERHMKFIGAKRIIADPIVSFIASTLSWAGARTNAVAIEPIQGAGFIELKIDDLGQRLAASSAS